VASGAGEHRPQGEYLHGEDERVLTQQEFEERCSTGGLTIGAGGCVMIQCVGSREPGYPYCSRTCCTEAVRNAILIKERWPGTPVFVLYRDIRTYGLREELYSRARRLGVVFVRYTPEARPQVSRGAGSLLVRVHDPVLGRPIVLTPDLLLLGVGRRPDAEAAELSRTLKLPLGQDGFFLEAHMKLRPLDFASEGIFLCGLAHGPKSVDEIIAQARGAAGRAGTILSKPRLYVSGQTSVVDGERCAACLTCLRVCPYAVPTIRDKVAYIETASCQGCGACASACPRKAITTRHVSDRQVLAKLTDLFPAQDGRPPVAPEPARPAAITSESEAQSP
ncbi:MAG: CoB--CoM heterodisulfide reductase iron-sulfur subunit A family protein, partial [Deltaproteobacteria bacterium]|nr:CoB--CoM heterodisulfide reductase iron-sulfur subunit A family protein [Deltaproteobacteria bacterium]